MNYATNIVLLLLLFVSASIGAYYYFSKTSSEPETEMELPTEWKGVADKKELIKNKMKQTLDLQHNTFRTAHYDWWMFPITKPSNRNEYMLTQQEVCDLKNDSEFFKLYSQGINIFVDKYMVDNLKKHRFDLTHDPHNGKLFESLYTFMTAACPPTRFDENYVVLYNKVLDMFKKYNVHGRYDDRMDYLSYYSTDLNY